MKQKNAPTFSIQIPKMTRFCFCLHVQSGHQSFEEQIVRVNSGAWLQGAMRAWLGVVIVGQGIFLWWPPIVQWF